MKIMRSFAAIGIALSALALSACQATDTTQETDVSDINIQAEVDVATSRVIFPSSPFWLTEEERSVIDTAYNVAVNKCAQEELGINAQYPEFISLQTDVYEMFYEYGPWTEDMATRFGYVSPMTEADMRANGIVREGFSVDTHPSDFDVPELSEAEQERIDKECRTKPEIKEFDMVRLDKSRPAALYDLASNVEEKVKNNERGKKVFEDLKECYTKNGIAFKEIKDSASPTLVDVAGSNPDVINEEQIQLALKDVACKNEVNMIPRLADIWAEYEAPVIQENAVELQAYRKQIDDLLEKANAYINENSQYLYLP